jgi:hypothetical protein
VNSFLNPLLVQVMVNGYLFNMYKGVPLLKKGGTMIVTHPCTENRNRNRNRTRTRTRTRTRNRTRNRNRTRR